MIYKNLDELQNAVAEGSPVVIDRWALLDLCGAQGVTPGPGYTFKDTLFDTQANAALGIVATKALSQHGLQARLGSRIFVRVSAKK